MSFISIRYVVFLLVSSLAYWTIVPPKLRTLFLALGSFVFAASYHVGYAVLFVAAVCAVYCAGKFLSETASPGRKKFVFFLVLAGLAGGLCVHKYFQRSVDLFYSGSDAWPNAVAIFGLSYMTFRLIHYLTESYRKNIPAASFTDFLCYALFFPTFLSGPVERFGAFHAQTAKGTTVAIGDINYGLYRILRGMIKRVMVADFLWRQAMPALSHPSEYPKVVVVGAIYAITVQLYMDFSGCIDIAVGSARLFGYKIMENFNRPFFQKNIALFWRNWHISVYSWIRDYIFFPVFGHGVSRIKVYAGIFCTMTIFMLWHQFSPAFFVLGLYHGLGLVAWYFFQEIKKRHPSVQRCFARPWLDPFSIFLTFSFFSFSSIFFRLSLSGALSVINKLVG